MSTGINTSTSLTVTDAPAFNTRSHHFCTNRVQNTHTPHVSPDLVLFRPRQSLSMPNTHGLGTTFGRGRVPQSLPQSRFIRPPNTISMQSTPLHQSMTNSGKNVRSEIPSCTITTQSEYSNMMSTSDVESPQREIPFLNDSRDNISIH